MDIQFEKMQIGLGETVCDKTAEQTVEADISLPDYCPDISKILSCFAETSVNGVSVSDGKITADAVTVIRMIYAGQEGEPAVYEYTETFKKTVDAAEIDRTCAVSFSVRTSYVNCRAVSPRKAEVRASLSCAFKAERVRGEELLVGAEGAGVHCLTEKTDTLDVIGKTVRYHQMGETAAVGRELPAVKGILFTEASVSRGDLKAINDKLLVKGELGITVSYIGEDSGVASFRHVMPISMIIELEGLREDSLYDLSLECVGAQAVPGADSSGEVRLLDISCMLEAVLKVCRPFSPALIKDVYSTRCDIETKSRSIDCGVLLDSFVKGFQAKSAFECGDNTECVLAVSCGKPEYSCAVSGAELTVSGTFSTGLLLREKDGKSAFVQKNVEFKVGKTMPAEAHKPKTEVRVGIIACSAVITADGRVEIRAELEASAAVFETKTVKYVSEIEAAEEKKTDRHTAALTVCFCEQGDSLWSIAKKYYTTVEAVKAENKLEGDELQAGTMLIIPGMT